MMPLPVRSRRYDQKFWDELLGKKITTDDAMKALGF